MGASSTVLIIDLSAAPTSGSSAPEDQNVLVGNLWKISRNGPDNSEPEIRSYFSVRSRPPDCVAFGPKDVLYVQDTADLLRDGPIEVLISKTQEGRWFYSYDIYASEVSGRLTLMLVFPPRILPEALEPWPFEAKEISDNRLVVRWVFRKTGQGIGVSWRQSRQPRTVTTAGAVSAINSKALSTYGAAPVPITLGSENISNKSLAEPIQSVRGQHEPKANQIADRRFPAWAPILGATFGGFTLLFFMYLVISGRGSASFANVSVLALGLALSTAFLGGDAVARGNISFRGINPIEFAVGGGLAAFVIVFAIGLTLSNPAAEPRSTPPVAASSPIATASGTPGSCLKVANLWELGWREGNKTQFCISHGFESVTNVDGTTYRENGGGWCFTGDRFACLHQVGH